MPSCDPFVFAKGIIGIYCPLNKNIVIQPTGFNNTNPCSGFTNTKWCLQSQWLFYYNETRWFLTKQGNNFLLSVQFYCVEIPWYDVYWGTFRKWQTLILTWIVNQHNFVPKGYLVTQFKYWYWLTIRIFLHHAILTRPPTHVTPESSGGARRANEFKLKSKFNLNKNPSRIHLHIRFNFLLAERFRI